MQTLRSILRNNGLASSPQKECVQLLVSGSISVAMHQFLTTSSLGKPVLPDSCRLCHVWLVLQAHASCPDLRPILLNVWQEVIVLSRTTIWPYMALALGQWLHHLLLGCKLCTGGSTGSNCSYTHLSEQKLAKRGGQKTSCNNQAVMLVATSL